MLKNKNFLFPVDFRADKQITESSTRCTHVAVHTLQRCCSAHAAAMLPCTGCSDVAVHSQHRCCRVLLQRCACTGCRDVAVQCFSDVAVHWLQRCCCALLQRCAVHWLQRCCRTLAATVLPCTLYCHVCSYTFSKATRPAVSSAHLFKSRSSISLFRTPFQKPLVQQWVPHTFSKATRPAVSSAHLFKSHSSSSEFRKTCERKQLISFCNQINLGSCWKSRLNIEWINSKFSGSSMFVKSLIMENYKIIELSHSIVLFLLNKWKRSYIKDISSN